MRRRHFLFYCAGIMALAAVYIWFELWLLDGRLRFGERISGLDLGHALMVAEHMRWRGFPMSFGHTPRVYQLPIKEPAALMVLCDQMAAHALRMKAHFGRTSIERPELIQDVLLCGLYRVEPDGDIVQAMLGRDGRLYVQFSE